MPTELATPVVTSNEQVINGLWNQGTLLDLDIGRAGFRKANRDVDLDLKEVNKDAIHVGHRKLLPKVALEQLISIEHASREFLKVRSLAFPISGARFVYYRSLKEVVTYLEAKKTQWDAAVTKFIADFPALREEQILVLEAQSQAIMDRAITPKANKLVDLNAAIDVLGPEKASEAGLTAERRNVVDELHRLKAEWGPWFDEQRLFIRQSYPMVDDLPGMFRFGWHMFKINAVDGVSALSAMESTEMIVAQDKLKSEMQKWVKESAAALHKALGDAAVNTKKMLEKQGKLNPKNLKPLFDSFDVFKAVDFTGSSDFQKTIDAIKLKFGNDDLSLAAESINGTTAGMESFKGMLDTLSELAVDNVAETAGIKALTKVGEFRRLIEI